MDIYLEQLFAGQHTMPSSQDVLRLYRSFLREGRKFQQYNMREYVKRRARLGFKQNKALTDEQALEKCWQRALEDLAVVKRQVIVYGLYARPYQSVMDLKHEEEKEQKLKKLHNNSS
eukprot:TRINITY_DN16526_c0_g1_i2.p7 TRINITY_DN16526_c0_g1~~TRINITY_DN16526_c0_g1_i2.p7  ORF type:complete len:117 (-),score=4.88 TRINITY_DN16526_c0_g1_i2:1675-2025(-)